MLNTETPTTTPDGLKKLLIQKWPEAVATSKGLTETVFKTGLTPLDDLFPMGGIPCGQLIEITGSVACGKTGLLHRMLASLINHGNVTYIDFSGGFFPAAALRSGVDMNRLTVVKTAPGKTPATDSFSSGLRTAELLFNHHLATVVVLDLVGHGSHQPLSPTLMHRLRRLTSKARALVIFLTEDSDRVNIIPASMVSLRLQVNRRGMERIEVSVAKSRISKEGTKTELDLNDA